MRLSLSLSPTGARGAAQEVGEAPSGVEASGGTVTDVGSLRRHTYIEDGSLVVNAGGMFEFEAVGAGGAGGSSESGGGGGGSAGDVVRGTIELAPGTYNIVVGQKGLGQLASPSGLPTSGTATILFDGESFSVLARPGGFAGGRSPATDAVDGGGGNGSAAGGSLLGAAHPTSFSGGNGRTTGVGEDFDTRAGGGGRGAGGDGTNATESDRGFGGPAVASQAPGISASYGKGGRGGRAADSEDPPLPVNPGDGGSGGADKPNSRRRGTDGMNGIVHIWYEVA